jgi:HEAT repeat protein
MTSLRPVRPEVLDALASEALHNPNAVVRRGCLDYLDHVGGAESAPTFVAAMDDPVPRVRRHAIHALTCEACKDEPICVDVVTPLRRCIASDPNPRVRFEALRALLGRLDVVAGEAMLDEVEQHSDAALFDVAARARPRSVPAALRRRLAASS